MQSGTRSPGNRSQHGPSRKYEHCVRRQERAGRHNMKAKYQIVVDLTLFLLLVSAGAAAEARPGMRHPAKNKTYRFDTVDYPGAASSIVFDINTTDKTAVGIFRTVVTVAYGTGFALKGGK